MAALGRSGVAFRSGGLGGAARSLPGGEGAQGLAAAWFAGRSGRRAPLTLDSTALRTVTLKLTAS